MIDIKELGRPLTVTEFARNLIEWLIAEKDAADGIGMCLRDQGDEEGAMRHEVAVTLLDGLIHGVKRAACLDE